MGAPVNIRNCSVSNDVLNSYLDLLRTKIDRVTLSPPANIYSTNPAYMATLYKDIEKLNVNISKLNKFVENAPCMKIKGFISLVLPVAMFVTGFVLLVTFAVTNPTLFPIGLGLYLFASLEEAFVPITWILIYQLWHRVKYGSFCQGDDLPMHLYPLPLGAFQYLHEVYTRPDRLTRKVEELANNLDERLDRLENPLLILAGNHPAE